MARFINTLKNFTPIADTKRKINKAVELELTAYYKNRLEEIVAPFETDFRFEVVENETADGDDISYVLRPVEEMIQRDTSGNNEVSSWILFNTLDLGSDNAAKVYLPDDFENETSPNSTNTRHSDYERSKIFVDSSQRGAGMEPRNWTKLLREERESRTLNRTRTLVTRLAKNALGIK